VPPHYALARRAVTSLDAAGVPHSDLSIVANNSDSWYSTDNKVDRDRYGVDDRRKVRLPGARTPGGPLAARSPSARRLDT